MFSKEQIQAHRDQKAPAALYEKVMQASGESWQVRGKRGLALVALAACLLLVVSLSFWIPGQESISVSLEGQVLEEKLVLSPSASARRAVPTTSISFALVLKEETHISVSTGNLLNAEGEALTKMTAEGEVLLSWEIPQGAELSPCEMKLKNNNKTTVITLSYDPEQEAIVATKTES